MEDKKIKNFMTVNIVLMAVLIVLISIILVFILTTNNRLSILEANYGNVNPYGWDANKIANGESTTGGQNQSTSDDSTFIDIENEATAKNMATIIKNQVDELTSSNVYIPLIQSSTDTPSALSIFNSHGESIYTTSSNETEVFLNNGNTVYFGDQVAYIEDVNRVNQCADALSMIINGSKYADMRIVYAPDATEYTEYIVDIHSWDGVYELFSLKSAELANDYVSALKSTIAADMLDEGVDTDYINYRYAFVISNDDTSLLSSSAYYYFGENSDGAWSDCWLIWAFEGVIHIDDWQLDDGWYSFKYDELSEDNVNVLETLMSNLDSSMDAMMSKIANEQGLVAYTPDKDGDYSLNENYEPVDESRPHVHNEDGTVIYLDEHPEVEPEGVDETRPHIHNEDGTITYIDEPEVNNEDANN